MRSLRVKILLIGAAWLAIYWLCWEWMGAFGGVVGIASLSILAGGFSIGHRLVKGTWPNLAANLDDL